MSLPWWSSPAVRLTWRQTSIYDALLALSPYLDTAVRDRAHLAALSRGPTPVPPRSPRTRP
ncbi:hypothetical protein SHKM778_29030 [Streptomyces sp. KM77-8]|uniref:Uncharacterized protein n=1 Tax=Streptomyces haneummycinicus TaxID=3074435 RepID=A0AAT9HG98_9ACTN